MAEDFEQPPVDPAGIVSAWNTWAAGDELPGRTMADLKIAGLPVVLETLRADNELVARLLEQWTMWEKAKAIPQEALDAMTETGLAAVIDAFDEAQ